MKKTIIGIAGRKGSGKDTAASMIDYILRAGFAATDYYEWKERYDGKISYNETYTIIHFADKLKEICADIFDIGLDRFYNPKLKDEYLYSITTQTFIHRENLNETYYEITIDDLRKHNLNLHETRVDINKQAKRALISIRTMMQYIGTEIYRNLINYDYWIECVEKAIDDMRGHHMIIPDVRFNNEAGCIKQYAPIYNTLIIEILRDSNNKDNHESEQGIGNMYIDTRITNNGSKMELFYKLLNYLQNNLK